MSSPSLIFRVASAILLGAVATACASPKTAATASPTAPTAAVKAWPDPNRHIVEIEKFAEIDMRSRYRPGSIVALGSSSIRHWHETIGEDLDPFPIMRRGFGGSNMNDAAYFVDRIAINYAPSAILLYEGDNDIADGLTPEQVIAAFHELKSKVRAALPECRIYIISVKPSPSREAIWPVAQKLNELLKAEAKSDAKVTFIDVATPMLGADGKPRPELFEEDQLHMTRKGYEVWGPVVKAALEANQPGVR